MRRLVPLLVIALLVVACSGDGDASSTAAGATTSATEAEATSTSASSAETTTTTSGATSTSVTTEETTTTTSTTTTIAPGPGALALTRVVFTPVAYIAITNIGNAPAALDGYWLCRRPAYEQLPALTLEPGGTVAIGLGDDPPPDLVEFAEIIELGNALGPLDKDGGEIGLYTAATFDNPNAMVDYVEWGSAGHGRSDVAVAAGIWVEGDFVELPPEATSMSSSGAGGVGAADWFADVGG